MSYKGVDLSQWNRGLTVANVKAAGYSFAILRAGYTGYGAGHVMRKDPDFENFYKQAKAVNMPVGAYWFSCANDTATGKAEARFIIDNCLKGKQFEYPIYIDVEDIHNQAGNKKGTTDAIIAFCKTLEAAGYFAGIYASLDWFRNKIDTKRLDAFTKWVACWTSRKPGFSFPAFNVWQNTSKAKIGTYIVDGNISYRDFPAEIKAAGLNGYTKAAKKPAKPASKKKTVEEIAKEVLVGKWGNGDERKQKLKAAGYNYDSVQKKVNQLLRNA